MVLVITVLCSINTFECLNDSLTIESIRDCTVLFCVTSHLTAEIKEEWQELDEDRITTDALSDVAQRRVSLLKMVNDIVPYLMQHNAESEACDLLMEIEKLDILEQYVDQIAYPRVCLYLRR